MKEKDLIDGLKEKDFKVFEELVKKYQPMIINVCYNMTGSKEDAEDLAQEVFIKTWKKADRFRGDSSLQTWIYRIAINTSLNFTRQRKLQGFLHSIDSVLNLGRDSSNPQKELEKGERQNMVQSAIQSLPENQRIALTLQFFQDHSYAEVGEIMNISISAVESLIFRAKRNLKKKLGNYYLKGS